jgi:hypothetical protein
VPEKGAAEGDTSTDVIVSSSGREHVSCDPPRILWENRGEGHFRDEGLMSILAELCIAERYPGRGCVALFRRPIHSSRGPVQL